MEYMIKQDASGIFIQVPIVEENNNLQAAQNIVKSIPETKPPEKKVKK